MFHIELRQFPHNFCRFNLSEAALASLLAPWAEGLPIELGERKWNPHQAKITILEGPELELQELSMGRGWRTAERRSRDVTDSVLPVHVQPPVAVNATPGGGPARPRSTPVSGAASPVPVAPPGAGGGGSALADPLAALVQIGALLGAEAPLLLEAWRAATAEDPSRAPSQALAAAEAALRGAPGSVQPEPPEG